MTEREQVEKAKKKVLAVYPDAEPKVNDYGAHWIGLPVLSDFFEEDEEKLAAIDALPLGTDEEIRYITEARQDIEQEAIDAAWLDAASRLPAPVSQPEAGQEEPCENCGKFEKAHRNGLCFGDDLGPGTERFTKRQPAPQADAAQVESGDGLPLLAEWEDANVQRVYSILNDELEHKSDEEHWEGYCARWIVGELIDPLNAEIQRLKGLLREIEDEAYDRIDIDNEGRPNWAMRVHERIKAAVTGE